MIMDKKHFCWCRATALAWLMFFTPVKAACTEPLTGAEYRVKAGFIYHFVRYTQWPAQSFENSNAPLRFCVASTRPGTDIFMSLQSKAVKKRKIEVIRYVKNLPAFPCQIIFITSDDLKFVLKRLEEVKGQKVLTVGESENFVQAGGVIAFFIENDRLRFKVNLDAAARAGLKFSSQLLMSAEIVREGQ